MINLKKNHKKSGKSRILVAPLDWGLGHATRCIPIINQLLSAGAEVLIAADGAIALLLRKEFPQILFLELTGYRVKYSRKKSFLPLRLLAQFPKIIFKIYKEHQWLKKIISDHNVDAVISDNRFGLYNKKIFCVYITHQLLIKTGNKFTEKIAQRIHYWFIKKYDECWVLDYKGVSLAGELSHPAKLPGNVKYIGSLSRLEKVERAVEEYDALILISGPEPQRSILEEILLSELKNFSGKFLFVRGLPGTEKQHLKSQMGKIINHLSSVELSKVIQRSKIAIARSGYTTIMDLVKLQKKAILIPTPGQTEQEYLAKYLMQQKMFYSVQQKDFHLPAALKGAAIFPFNIPLHNMEEYKIVVDNFVHSL